MKASQIRKRYLYSNGADLFRLVLDEGNYTLYPGQMDHDCILYLGLRLKAGALVHDGRTRWGGTNTGRSTRASFASWAKVELDMQDRQAQAARELAISILGPAALDYDG